MQKQHAAAYYKDEKDDILNLKSLLVPVSQTSQTVVEQAGDVTIEVSPATDNPQPSITQESQDPITTDGQVEPGNQ